MKAVGAGGGDPFGLILREACDLAKAEAQGEAALIVGFHRIVPIRAVDAERAHLDPVFAGVADDLGRRVEAHRLRVQQGAGEYPRMAAFEPCACIDQEGETGGVAFGEAVAAEAFDLGETAFSEVTLVSVLRHAAQETGAKGADVAVFFEGCEGSAQAVRLIRRKARAGDGDLHRLFLKQGHAKGFAQHAAKVVRGEVHMFLTVAATQVGVDHVALNGAGADDRDLNDEVIKAARAHAG